MVSPRVIGLKGEIIFPRQYNVDDGDVNIVNLVAGSSDHHRVSFVIHAAARSGQVDMVQILFWFWTNVNEQGDDLNKPLHFSA